MVVLGRKALKEFALRHSDAGPALEAWYRTARAARWRSIADVRLTYPHADFVGGYAIFNIKGNTYRLVAIVNYPHQSIAIKRVLTHARYDKDEWK